MPFLSSSTPWKWRVRKAKMFKMHISSVWEQGNLHHIKQTYAASLSSSDLVVGWDSKPPHGNRNTSLSLLICQTYSVFYLCADYIGIYAARKLFRHFILFISEIWIWGMNNPPASMCVNKMEKMTTVIKFSTAAKIQNEQLLLKTPPAVSHFTTQSHAMAPECFLATWSDVMKWSLYVCVCVCFSTLQIMSSLKTPPVTLTWSAG